MVAVVSLFDAVLVNLRDPLLQWAFITALIGPFTWNIIARLQYYYGALSGLFGGNKRVACYALAFYILAVGFYRDYSFHQALANQPKIAELASDNVWYLGAALFAFGQLLVLTSFYQLGFIGTFLGDYFGFLASAPATGFPYNLPFLSNPMYIGATMSFAGHALMKQSAAGLLLTLWVYIIYRAALAFEEPFTNFIYAEAARKKAANKNKK